MGNAAWSTMWNEIIESWLQIVIQKMLLNLQSPLILKNIFKSFTNNSSSSLPLPTKIFLQLLAHFSFFKCNTIQRTIFINIQYDHFLWLILTRFNELSHEQLNVSRVLIGLVTLICGAIWMIQSYKMLCQTFSLFWSLIIAWNCLHTCDWNRLAILIKCRVFWVW